MSTLVILAAGLGSRFGGNKQLAEFGERKLTLMEYNIIHAAQAGFTDVVFIIRPELEQTLTSQVIPRLPNTIKAHTVHQSLSTLPQGCQVNTERTKPLGTAHALWCCHKLIKTTFAVINADDYYGAQAFNLLFAQAKSQPNDHAMVAYQLKSTLSEFGGVNRGLCQVSPHSTLQGIEECEDIQLINNTLVGRVNNNEHTVLKDNSLISMNCWLFNGDIFALLENEIRIMLSEHSQTKSALSQKYLKQECYLPTVVMKQIKQQQKNVHVLCSTEQWFGLTYPQDAALVDKKVTAIFK